MLYHIPNTAVIGEIMRRRIMVDVAVDPLSPSTFIGPDGVEVPFAV